MKFEARKLMVSCVAALSSMIWNTSGAQFAAGSASDSGVSLTRLIESVAHKSGKKFIVDPRVKGDALLIGQNIGALEYEDLLEVLLVHDFVAFERGGYVHVVPRAVARLSPSPTITGKESRPDALYVTRIIKVENIPAVQLVPVLRPMLPQSAHLVAVNCTNALIVVDTFGNVKRIESVVAALDVGTPYKPDCTAATPGPAK